MSNGDPDPVSGSPYIIICNGRTAVALAKNYDDKVVAASTCAATFAAFMGIVYGNAVDFATDLAPITTIQHELMNHALGVHAFSHDKLDAKFIALFDAMTALEREY